MGAALAYRFGPKEGLTYEYLTPEEARVFRETGVLPSRVEVWPDNGASKRILRIEDSPDEKDKEGAPHAMPHLRR